MSAKNHAEQQEPRYTKAELNAEYCRGRIDGWEAAMSAPQGEAIYIVATGEVHEGLETYTRHDSPPPLCEFEKLYTAPQPYHFADASKMVPLTDELLGALRYIEAVAMTNGPRDLPDIEQTARDAIKKAEGRS